MALVLDEVGCNTSQETDNAVGGELLLTGRDDQAYCSVATRTNHFTVLGVTALSGDPVLCVVIISGKKGDIPVSTGVDWNAVEDELNSNIEEGDEIRFLNNNTGSGKMFPGGPICNFKGKDIPSFVTFTENGGMDGHVLTQVFQHLDAYEIFKEERENGLVPFVLLDGHQSRFELEFLKYVNGSDHKWNVCIGVPYGTSLWQVGDSNQQNGKFKILVSKKKREIFERRMNSFCQHLHLMRTDIMIIVRETWHYAFCDTISNKHAISERGWDPLNKALLLHPLIMATMTETMILNEKKRNIFPRKILQELEANVYNESNGTVSFGVRAHSDSNTKFNFTGGPIACHVANSIMNEVDREEARQRIKHMKQEGKTKAERIASITKRMTAGKLVVDGGSFHLNDYVLQQVQLKNDEIVKKAEDNRKRDELKFMIDCYKADEAIKRNNTPDVRKWKSASDIKDYLRPLRKKDDTGMPSKRGDLELRFLQWSCRGRVQMVHNKEMYDEFQSWLDNEKTKKKSSSSKRGKQNKKDSKKDKQI